MSLVGLTVASILFGIGTYLMLQRSLTRVIIGLAVMSNAVNLLIVMSGGQGGEPPVLGGGVALDAVSDPLPQAMVLTAIVITFGVTAFLLALALRSYLLTGNDDVEDDIEDRRIAQRETPDVEARHDDRTDRVDQEATVTVDREPATGRGGHR